MSEATAGSTVTVERAKLVLFALFGLAFLGLGLPAFFEPMTFWTGIVLGDHGFPTHELHHFVLGSLFGLLFLGVVAQAVRPANRVGALHTSLAVWLCLTVVFAAAGDFSPMFLLLLALLVGMAVTHPAGRDQVPSLDDVGRPMAALAGITALGGLAFAGVELNAYFTADDAHVEFGHYLFTAALGASLAVLAPYASLRGTGWRFPAYAAALFLAVIGLGSVVYPGAEQGSSLGVGLGLAVALLAVAFVAVAERGTDLTGATDVPADGGSDR